MRVHRNGGSGGPGHYETIALPTDPAAAAYVRHVAECPACLYGTVDTICAEAVALRHALVAGEGTTS
jgi:hypothetical protein